MSAGKPEKGSPLALWKERLTELFHRYQYALLVVAAGVVLMVLPALGGESKAEEPQPAQDAAQDAPQADAEPEQPEAAPKSRRSGASRRRKRAERAKETAQ